MDGRKNKQLYKHRCLPTLLPKPIHPNLPGIVPSCSDTGIKLCRWTYPTRKNMSTKGTLECKIKIKRAPIIKITSEMETTEKWRWAKICQKWGWPQIEEDQKIQKKLNKSKFVLSSAPAFSIVETCHWNKSFYIWKISPSRTSYTRWTFRLHPLSALKLLI